MTASRTITRLQDLDDVNAAALGDAKQLLYDAASGKHKYVNGGSLPLLPDDLVAPCDPRQVFGVASLAVANRGAGVRVYARKTGTLTDLAVFVGTSSGNIDAGVYSTDATRAKLFSTGSIACPAAGWAVVGNPNLAVTKGDQLEFFLSCDNITATFARNALGGSMSTLPTNFWAAPGGAAPKICTLTASLFPLPASISEASLSATSFCIFIMARVV
jgi:hypothetical protein